MLTTQYYSGTHNRGDTSLPTRNGLSLCISLWAVSSWVYPTNRTLFLCYRRYQLQQGWYGNHCRYHSRWLESNQLCSPFYLGGVIRLIGGYQRGIKSTGTVDSAEMSIIYGTPQNHWCTRTYQVATEFTNAEVILSLSTNVSSNHQKKRKNDLGIEGYKTRICFIQWFILMQRPYQQIFYQGKGESYIDVVLEKVIRTVNWLHYLNY